MVLNRRFAAWRALAAVTSTGGLIVRRGLGYEACVWHYCVGCICMALGLGLRM